MTRTLRRTWVPAGVGVLLIVQPLMMTAGQGRPARVYVSVVDADGQPVKGLTASDFGIRENGEEKEVLSAEPATQPVALALMTDGLGVLPVYSAPLVRAALGTIVRTIRSGTSSETQIGYMRFDSAAIQQVNFGSSAATLDRAIGRLTSFPGPSVLLEAIADTCPKLRRMSTDRRIMFAVVAGYRGDTSVIDVREIPECLRTSGASLWAIEAVFDSAPVGNNRRDYVMLNATALSGGMHAAVSSGNALEAAGLRLASVIVSQYAVEYGPPGRLQRGGLAVTVKRPNLRVLAPAWTSR